jgi:hypothetical protein
MKHGKVWKVLGILVGLFGIGVIIGVVKTHYNYKRVMEQMRRT